MKKIFGVLLSILCMCCIAIGLTGCSNNRHVHSYDKQVISEEYLASSATCTEKATYYYSCECGEKGTKTFEYGSTTNHNFVNGSCTYCGKKQEPSRGLAFTLLNDGTYEVSGIGSCTDTEIVILSVYNDKPVTSIGNEAFYGCSGLTSITIPDSVTSIGYRAFNGCTSLQFNEYDNGLYLGNDSNPYVALINNKSSGITSCAINENCKVVYCNAFSECSGLTSVTIGNSVTSIGDYAFSGCSGLTSVTIGNSVTFIGNYAFSGCYKLVEVINKSTLNIKKGSEDNGYVGYYALNVKKDGISDIVNKDGYLFYTYDNVNYLLAYVGSNTDLTLPDDYNGQNYKLYNYAFDGCSGLTSVTIPDSVTSIGNEAFSYCRGLTSVTIGNSVTSIGYSAFHGCSGLTSVTIGNSVTYIGDMAFYGCSGLTSVTIPDSVTSIGDWAFDGCSGLTSVTIPDSVTSIGWNAFYGCSGIESLVVTAENKKYHSANNCIIETGTKQLIVGCKTSIIPSDGSVTSIADWAFYYCSGLTSVTIPDSVTSIGERAFSYCSGLTSITYKGTIADWKNIDKGSRWNENVHRTCVIHCTDGDIKLFK